MEETIETAASAAREREKKKGNFYLLEAIKPIDWLAVRTVGLLPSTAVLACMGGFGRLAAKLAKPIMHTRKK